MTPTLLAAARRRQALRGYTFIEILTVVTIMGVLVALLLPAVQAAREAARRMSCQSRLSQVILAVHQYEAAHGVYPPGTIADQGPVRSQPQGYHHNWIVQVLPYLELENAYRHVDSRVGVYHAANRPVRRLAPQVLRCPSSPATGRGFSDYAGVHHEVEAPIDVDNNGSFFLNSRLVYDDIVDGTSNTAFIGEKRTLRGDLGWMSGTRGTLRGMGTPINFPFTGGVAGAVPQWAQQPPPGLDEGRAERESALEGDDVLNSLFGPDGTHPYGRLGGGGSPAQTPGLALTEEAGGGTTDAVPGEVVVRFRRPGDPLLAVGGFGSTHPGGAQFALGDGSVRFLTATIDFRLYLQLGHRADREMLGSFD